MLFAVIILLLSTVSADQFWLTTVVSDFKVRDQCAVFWNETHSCPSPLLRISTDINQPTQFVSRAWPMRDVLASTEKPSFISQWHGSLESVRVIAQIEGSSPVNPFGLVAKCDQGFHPSIVFNQSSVNVMETLSVRIIVIESQCFTAKVLVKVDKKCPYCPPPTTTAAPITVSLALPTQQNLLIACSVFLFLSCFFVVTFCCILHRYLKLRRGARVCPSLESGISTIAPLYQSTFDEKQEIIENDRALYPISPSFFDFDFDDVDLSEDILLPPLPSAYSNFCSDETIMSISRQVYV
ncbi:unnamed protein product [Caenorhabditis sp. 36 PRJEB53466]|nr:unnamed protein product [Caenorhabditis sp. 36 PRJEB53466]